MSAVKLGSSKAGVLVPIRARPRARRNAIDGARDGALVICVTAAPESGKANAAILDVLAESLGCAKSTLALTRGSKSRDKTVCVAALDEGEIEKRLEEILLNNCPDKLLD